LAGWDGRVEEVDEIQKTEAELEIVPQLTYFIEQLNSLRMPKPSPLWIKSQSNNLKLQGQVKQIPGRSREAYFFRPRF